MLLTECAVVVATFGEDIFLKRRQIVYIVRLALIVAFSSVGYIHAVLMITICIQAESRRTRYYVGAYTYSAKNRCKGL
jgi:acid stress-induced BolA-like protein IbaG/YrbA